MKKNSFDQKTVLLGVTGSIAVYKAVELVRLLRQQGAKVIVLMTQSAQQFVGPMTFQTLSGNEVLTDLFQEQGSVQPTHIYLADVADLFLVVPATANILGKMRYGLADDIVSCLYLATKAPVVIAPAMNGNMYRHPAVQENIEVLKSRGHTLVDPETGLLACGYEGEGKLAQVETILEKSAAVLGSENINYRRTYS